MRHINQTGSIIVAVLITIGSAFGQRTASLADNAALRYWAAFSQLQDSGITDREAQELNSILDRMGPYDPSKYKDLIQKNTPALEIMARERCCRSVIGGWITDLEKTSLLIMRERL